MIRRLIYMFGTMMVLLSVLTACQDYNIPSSGSEKDVSEGYMAIKFKLDVPEMTEIQVRAADPDGVNIHNLSLYCFNEYGLYIGYVEAKNFTADDADQTGTFKAEIPEDTKIIHFLGNQNNDLYNYNQLRGKSEDEVIAKMDGGSGMIIFWGRFEATEPETLQTEIATASPIQLIRNQAMVTTVIGEHKDNNQNTIFTVTGFRTVNIHAFGTVAPWCPEHHFAMSQWPCPGSPFVTLPTDLAMMSDIEDVNTKTEDYVFEHENSLDNPVSVIIRGHHLGEGDKYYRVLMVDTDGNQIMIRRNHKYIINIVGPLSYGQDSFAAALEAPATNNVWVSVDAWVNEVSDANYTLSVEKTSVVYTAKDITDNYPLALNYTLTKKNGNIDDSTDKPEVTWLPGNTVAYESFTHNFTEDSQNAAQGNGTININLHAMTDVPQHVGTLMIRKGKLYRTIEVVVIHTQTFVPSWLSSQIYKNVGSTDESRAHATLIFTIPETCPESLFPFPVLISVNSLDIRSEAGMELPVVVKGDNQYFGEDYPGIEYKYVYTVDKPGVHRVYFENILSHKEGDVTQYVYLEAEHFETLTKSVIYSDEQYAITLPNLLSWRPTTGSGTEYHEDDYVYYTLVPQKKGAEVNLKLRLMDLANNSVMEIADNDEFMLYSKTLDFMTEHSHFHHHVVDVPNSTTGRIQAFCVAGDQYNPVKDPDGSYELHLVTNASRSADVVRIASNHAGSPSLHSSNNYTGRGYRDIIFELANYRPFGFAATMTYPNPEQTDNQITEGWSNGDSYGNDQASSYVEPVTPIVLSYQPNQDVKISFDVASFTSGENTVSPFGREFKIYIDAPMLVLGEIGNLPIIEENGRFIYTVPATQIADLRVEIPFKKTSICSAGEITLSSQEEEVVFYKKTFKLSNKKITGTIELDKDNNGTVDNEDGQLPADAFVAFIRNSTRSRIGAIVVTLDNQGKSHYSLNLRSEYEFEWNDKVILEYKHNNGSYYEYRTTLSDLFTSPNVVLVPALDTVSQ